MHGACVSAAGGRLNSHQRFLGSIVVAWALVPVPGRPQDLSRVEQLYEEAQSARTRGDFATAERLYIEVIRRAPELANAYHNLGIVYFMQRKYEGAAEVLEQAIRLDSKLGPAHAMLGLAYYELYRPEKAAKELQVALRLNPSGRATRVVPSLLSTGMRSRRP